MTPLQHFRRIVPLFALALMLAISGQLKAQEVVTAEVTDTGKGWRLLEAVSESRTTPGVPMWEVTLDGISVMPVSEAQKEILLEAFADDPSTEVIYVSQELLAAMENPDFPAGYEQYIEPEQPSGTSFSLGCEWETETRNRSWSYSESLFSQSLPFSNPFQGQLSLDIPITGQVQVAATYKIRECFGVPVGFEFVGATGNGTAAVSGNGDLDATISASALFEREWKLTEPELGSVSFSVGVIPVRLVFTLPIYAGVRLEAAISGHVEAHLDATASGTFSFNCTTRTCSGTSNFTDQFEFTGAEGSVTVDLKAQAHARPMLRVGLYDEDFAYVEGGLKAYAKARIWGYYGNNCGDADGNGVNETVQALAADLSWGYQFAYGLGGWALPDQLRFTGGNEYLLGWRDLLGPGGSTALAPMIEGPSSVDQNAQATYTIKMRPCYPYTNAVNFTMGPGTWTGGTTVTPPSGTATVQRSFPSPGNQTLVATATTDGFGRNLQTSSSRTISVTATIPVVPSGLTATVLSATSVRLNWVDNSNNETQFLIERRNPGGSFIQIGAVGTNVTTYTDTTVQQVTSYEYRVRASNSAGSSNPSNSASVTTPPAGAPAAPSSLTATVLSATSVRLNWIDNSNNEAQFEIYRGSTLIGTVGTNVTTYTDSTVQPSTSYEYKVRATNSAGASAYSNKANVTTLDVVPTAPSGLTASFNTTTRTINLSWTDNSNNEQGFTVQFSYSGSAFSNMGSVGANVRTFSSGSNPPTGSYQFRVQAYNSLTSAWSNVASLTVLPPPPAATSILWIQTAESTWGPAGTLTVGGHATNGTGTVQLVWRERSSSGVWGAWNTVPFQPTPNANGEWSNTISSGNPTNRCHWFDAYTNYSGVTSTVFHYTGAPDCVPPSTSIAWIQRAESTWGPAGTLTVAGWAANGTGTVQLVWRERSSSGVWGAWNTVAFQATPNANNEWSNTISSGNPTNACHWFDAYTNYSGVTSSVFRYTGAPGCP